MKLAIVADTHFGHAKWGEDAFLQGKAAILEAAEKADALILAGDIFDSATPSLNALSEFASLLRQASVPVLAIHGTHEMRPKGQANPIQFMHSAGLLVNIHQNRQVLERDGQKIAITGMGGVPENYVREALKKSNFSPLPNHFNVFVFHQSLSEFIPNGKEEFISFEELPAGFDLYVCGHVHKSQFAFDGKLIIPGSTVITQMRKEEEGAKGYVVYDTLLKKGEFFPIIARPFHFVSLSFVNAQPEEVANAVKKEVERIVANEKEKPIIRIVLSGSMREGLVQGDVSFQKFEQAFVFVENSLSSKTLAARVEALRQNRAGKMSAVKMGLEVLRIQLEGCGVDAEELEGLLDKLAQGEELELEKHLRFKKKS